MNENQKNDILSMILKNSIQNFNNVLLSDYLSAIIDGNSNQQSTVEELQNLFFQKIKFERDQMYNKFIKSENEHKQNSTRTKPNNLLSNSSHLSNQDKNKIILNITEKYKNCIEGYNTIKEKNKTLKSKYNNIITQCKEVQNICLGQLKIMKSYETEIHKLKNINSKLTNELNHAQIKIKKLESNNVQRSFSSSSNINDTLELGNSLNMYSITSSNDLTKDNNVQRSPSQSSIANNVQRSPSQYSIANNVQRSPSQYSIANNVQRSPSQSSIANNDFNISEFKQPEYLDSDDE
jgi:hypothetical protein